MKKFGTAQKNIRSNSTFNAFTLAEVLITLGIIGVISAMTLQTLITNYRAKRLQSQFFKSYSTLQQVFKKMDADSDSLDPTVYKTGEFYKVFAKHLKGAIDCGRYNSSYYEKNAPCYNRSSEVRYKNLTQKSNYDLNLLDDGGLVMPDGSLILFENNVSGTLFITVDLNGYSKLPNAIGYDTFVFDFVDSGLLPMGASGTHYTDVETYCNSTSTASLNGITCAEKAMKDRNYFKSVVKNFK